MNVFLMHRAKDFDSKQELPHHETDLIQDLALNTLFEAMACGDKFLHEVSKQTILSSLNSPEDIRYRQEILKDCLENPDIIRQIYHIPIQSIENKRRSWMGIYSRYPSGILSSAIQLLEMFVELLRVLKQIADEHAEKFVSEGFQRFFAMIKRELDEDYFTCVENHLKNLKFRNGVLISANLGTGNEGENYVLRNPKQMNRLWVKRVFARKSPTYSFTIHPRDDSGARAIEEMKGRGISLVCKAAARSADHLDNFFNVLRLELAFYIGCLNLAEQLAQLDEPITFPQPSSSGELRHSFSGMYDVCLALTMEKTVVGNEVNADGKDLVMITGTNQGGKSTFLRSIGLAQLMMQCGMYVAAESFSANICSNLFTHYRREEDETMKSGKFDEELGRMSTIIDRITPDSLILFNESFAATNEREGSEIARQIISALLEQHIKVFFVTHQYELAGGFYEKAIPNALFLRAERLPDGTRTFKLLEAEPLPTSFGKDLYYKVFGDSKA